MSIDPCVGPGWLGLVALAECELALARDGRWDELAAAAAERAGLTAGLPSPPPPAAREALERLRALQAELVATIARARGETLRELTELGRGRGAVRGYGAAGRVGDQRVDGAA